MTETLHEPRSWRNDVRAIAFDVQGTCADFYNPVLRAGISINASTGLAIKWDEWATEWRQIYRSTLDDIIDGRRAWMRVDQIYREALDVLLKRHGLDQVITQQERDSLNAVWTRLDPWPDVAEGLSRLRRRFVTTTLSNAGMAAVVAVVKHAGLPFDAILSAELAKIYKPAPAVYQLAVDYLGFQPNQILMVACHKYDLRAAKAFGMRTAFVARPLEFGPNAHPDIGAESWIDCCVDDFVALADELGSP